MHTHGIDGSNFSIWKNGQKVDASLLLDWDETSRLGVIVNESFGGLGAGVLIGLAMDAFYGVGKRRSELALYPDCFLFHVDKQWGNHGGFDFWPEYREVSVPGQPASLIEAINAHAITHLLIPDGRAGSFACHYAERAAALTRLKKCFVYSSSGLLDGSDVRLECSDPIVLDNFRGALDPQQLLAQMDQLVTTEKNLPSHVIEDIDAFMRSLRARIDEVDPHDPGWSVRRAAFCSQLGRGTLAEQLLEIGSEEAVSRIAGCCPAT